MTISIVGLGEVLWDVFPDGARFGGAPANFACTAKGVGREQVAVYMASGVGDDPRGHEALQTLRDKGVDTAYMQISDRPTGQVFVQLDAEGKASYDFPSGIAWDDLQWRVELQELSARADVVCFGTLGQRSEASRKTIQHFLSSMRENALRIFDINIRPPFYSVDTIEQSLQLANVLKLNDDELPLLSELCKISGEDLDVMQQLARRYDLQCVALTRGAGGAALMRGNEFSPVPGVETQVVDTVGAGDAFTAALAVGLAKKLALDEINRHATRLAAYVCSQAGATPRIPDELALSH